jgi:NAD(P)-dependent dehydrogenase (short-subunit alcohol dehydrogenase family)
VYAAKRQAATPVHKKTIMIQTDEFRNQTVLITGASAGIGAAAAQAFGSGGAHVIVHYNTRRDAAEQVVNSLQAKGGTGEIVQADLGTKEGIESLCAWVGVRPIDVLVNNAGSLVRRTKVLDFTPELMEQVLLLNFTSAFFVAQAVLPGMVERKHGAIVNISSVAARNGGGIGALAYASAKAALSAMTKNMAREFGPSGIRVNTVSPGTIDTDYHRAFSTEQMLNNVRAATPAGRLGTSEEVADAIVYLCSHGARFIQGQALEVNGGFLMV